MEFTNVLKGIAILGGLAVVSMATIQTVRDYKSKTGIFEPDESDLKQSEPGEPGELGEDVDGSEQEVPKDHVKSEPDVKININNPSYFSKKNIKTTLIVSGIVFTLGAVVGIKLMGKAANVKITSLRDELNNAKFDLATMIGWASVADNQDDVRININVDTIATTSPNPEVVDFFNYFRNKLKTSIPEATLVTE